MDNTKCDLFVFAAEPSADLHGEALLHSLYAKRPSLRIMGVGGPKMRAQGLKCVMPMERFEVMGFIDVLLALPRLILQFYSIARTILALNPPVAVFIDYPGFNLRMEKHLRKKGYKGKLVHYICPTVWAWGKGRIKIMEENLDLLLTILPFEKKCFDSSKLQVEYVGHPLIARIKKLHYQELDLPKDKRVIAIFPGSRRKEIQRNFPFHVRLMKKLLQKQSDLCFAISISQEMFLPLIRSILASEGILEKDMVFLIPNKCSYDLMKRSEMAIAKSGTVTLELALHNVPTVVTYAITKLDCFLAQKIFKISLPYFSLPNLLCDEMVFPELFGPNYTEENLEKEVRRFLENKKAALECKQLCEKLHSILSDKEASEEAALFLLKELQEPPRG